MKKHRFLAFILALTLMFSIINSLVVQRVSATPGKPIKLPFTTSWEDETAWGREDYVDDGQDFSNPELGRIPNQTASPDIFGYSYGLYHLRAAGSFDSSYSYCYFSLFDQDSDYCPPFKIRQHTFISIFYHHVYASRQCMIDAQLCNSETHQYWTLRDFNYNGEYIVDQNGVRIHPAHRWNDPYGSWQYASFDLSIIYEQDPNWYVTKIWVGFDNGIKGWQGQAKTYFDKLIISYGVVDKVTQIIDEPLLHDNSWITACVEVVDQVYWDLTDRFDLWLKVAVSGFNDGYKFQAAYPEWPIYLYPYKLKVSADHPDAEVLDNPMPTGVNLTDTKEPPNEAPEWCMDVAMLLLEMLCAPPPWLLPAVEYAIKFWELLNPPPEEPTYEWPVAHWGEVGVGGYIHYPDDWDPKNVIAGEVYIKIPGLSRGSHSFTFTFTVDNYFKEPWPTTPPYDMVIPIFHGSLSLPLTIEWSSEPDDVNLPPETPQNISGENLGYVGATYGYSTSTWDPNDNLVGYLFDWGDDSTSWTSTGSASHSWSSPGSYDVTVKAQDSYGLWSGLSPPLTVNIVNRPPGTPSTPWGPTTVRRTEWSTYSTSTTDPDGDDVRYQFEFTGPGTNVLFTTGWYESGQTGSITVQWGPNAPLGVYQIRARAQDVHQQWGGWSTPLTVTLVPSLTVLAEWVDGSSTDGYVWIDDEYDRPQNQPNTGSTFTVTPGTHTVFIDDFWESENTGYRYKFQYWEVDGSIEYSRTITITVVEDMTIKAIFLKEDCPGDVNGDGWVNVLDMLLVNIAYSLQKTAAEEPTCDLNGDHFINVLDMLIVQINYG